jgi:hypothetical protein
VRTHTAAFDVVLMSQIRRVACRVPIPLVGVGRPCHDGVTRVERVSGGMFIGLPATDKRPEITHALIPPIPSTTSTNRRQISMRRTLRVHATEIAMLNSARRQRGKKRATLVAHTAPLAPSLRPRSSMPERAFARRRSTLSGKSSAAWSLGEVARRRGGVTVRSQCLQDGRRRRQRLPDRRPSAEA